MTLAQQLLVLIGLCPKCGTRLETMPTRTFGVFLTRSQGRTWLVKACPRRDWALTETSTMGGNFRSCMTDFEGTELTV